MLVFGTDFFGKVDEVPGVFHVATRFDHVFFLPVLPLRSYVILHGTGKPPLGVKIKMSFRSVLLAWTRTVTVVTMFFSIAMLCFIFAMVPGSWYWVIALGIALVSGGIFTASFFVRGLRTATFERAVVLGRQAGLDDAAMAAIGRVYGQAIPRPFEVVPPA